MISNVRFAMKRAKFDADKVRRRMDKNTLRAMDRTGGTLRKYMQYSMKDRATMVSPPGSPPYARKHKLLKRLIYYHYDTRTKRLVVGPILYQGAKTLGLPKLMEKGGSIQEVQDSGRVVIRQYEPRPYAGPALTANMGKIAGFYAEAGLS